MFFPFCVVLSLRLFQRPPLPPKSKAENLGMSPDKHSAVVHEIDFLFSWGTFLSDTSLYASNEFANLQWLKLFTIRKRWHLRASEKPNAINLTCMPHNFHKLRGYEDEEKSNGPASSLEYTSSTACTELPHHLNSICDNQVRQRTEGRHCL